METNCNYEREKWMIPIAKCFHYGAHTVQGLDFYSVLVWTALDRKRQTQKS